MSKPSSGCWEKEPNIKKDETHTLVCTGRIIISLFLLLKVAFKALY